MADPSTNDELTTRWSMLDRLDGSRAEDSWRWFIGRYREFVLEALRGILREPDEAQRAGDDFWGYLFTSKVFASADRARRFRAFLSGTVRNFARDWRNKNRVRGVTLPDDADVPDDRELPESEELRIWSRTVLTLCLRELHDRFPDQADVLCWFYGIARSAEEDPRRVPTSEIAARLGVRTEVVHQHLSRGRRRLRSLLEREIEATVRHPDEFDDELRALVTAMLDETPGLVDY